MQDETTKLHCMSVDSVGQGWPDMDEESVKKDGSDRTECKEDVEGPGKEEVQL